MNRLRDGLIFSVVVVTVFFFLFFFTHFPPTRLGLAIRRHRVSPGVSPGKRVAEPCDDGGL